MHFRKTAAIPTRNIHCGKARQTLEDKNITSEYLSTLLLAPTLQNNHHRIRRWDSLVLSGLCCKLMLSISYSEQLVFTEFYEVKRIH